MLGFFFLFLLFFFLAKEVAVNGVEVGKGLKQAVITKGKRKARMLLRRVGAMVNVRVVGTRLWEEDEDEDENEEEEEEDELWDWQEEEEHSFLMYQLKGSFDGVLDRKGGDKMDAEIWSNLPELCVERVVRMLPPASKFRFRAVSRAWRSLLSDPKVVRQQAAPAQPVFCSVHYFARRKDQPVPAPQCPRFCQNVTKLDLEFLPACPDFCDWFPRFMSGEGLICFANTRNDITNTTTMLMLNPMTRCYRLLPHMPIEDSNFWSFGLMNFVFHFSVDAAKGTFQVVVTGHNGMWEMRWGVAVYSSGSDSWEIFKHEAGAILPTSPNSQRVLCNRMLYTYHNGFLQSHMVADERIVSIAAAGPITPPDLAPHEDFLVTCCGRVYFVAALLTDANPGGKVFGIWELDEEELQLEQLSLLPDEMLQRVTQHARAECTYYLEHVIVSGRYICFEIFFTREALSEKAVVASNLLAFNVRNCSWQVIAKKVPYDFHKVHLFLPRLDLHFTQDTQD